MAIDAVDAAVAKCGLKQKQGSGTDGLILDGGYYWTPNHYIKLAQDYGNVILMTCVVTSVSAVCVKLYLQERNLSIVHDCRLAAFFKAFTEVMFQILRYGVLPLVDENP